MQKQKVDLGLYRLGDADGDNGQTKYVLVKGVSANAYDIESFPGGLEPNPLVPEALRELSDNDRRAVLADDRVSSWLNSHTRGNLALGQAVGRSLESRTNLT